MLSRRCGVLAILHWYLFALLAILPSFSLGQALTLVHSSTRYAGTGSAGFSGDYGAATTVTLNAPSYIAFDSNGNQFLSDTLNNCVRKIDTAGNITTVAGLAVSGQSDTCNSSSNNTPTASEGLYHPTGLAIDSSQPPLHRRQHAQLRSRSRQRQHRRRVAHHRRGHLRLDPHCIRHARAKRPRHRPQ